MRNAKERNLEIKELRKRYEMGGGAKAIEKLHTKGKLTARERIERLVDANSFREFNLWAQPTRTGFDTDQRESPGDGLVAGFARIDGRPVCVYAHDFTVLGGSQSSVQNWKVCKTMDTAVRLGIPCIGIIDSGGVRIQDAFGIPNGRGVSRNCDVWYSSAMASGIVPSLSLTLGASYAGTAYSPFMADVFFMVKKADCYMSLSSPELIKSVTFEDVTREEIGAAQLHAEVTGSCDYLGETEEEVLQKGRELLSFLPSNCRQKPPYVETGDRKDRIESALLDIIPVETDKPYDVRDVICRIVDNGYFFELKREYAQNVTVGLARLGGHSVGIIANNPLFLDGTCDLRSAEKQARFIRYCDAFNVPLIFFVDTPGFVADINLERQGLARHMAMVMYAICEATVPKITVYMRRCYGNGHLMMGTRLMGADAVLAWSIAQIHPVDFKVAVEAVYRKSAENLEPGEVEEFQKKYFDSPRRPGALLMIDDIIDPSNTRPILIDILEIVAKKNEVRPLRKHGNIPL